jgi:hypothetical protein
LGTKLIWSTLSRRAAAKTVITETIEKRLIARGASSELAELATLSEEEMSKIRGGAVSGKPPLMNADDLNKFVAQVREGMGDKLRLTTAERTGAREILGVLERVRNGDSWAWAELIPRRLKALAGTLKKGGWAEVDLLANNPGGLNKMRMLIRVVKGDIEVKLMQMH